MIFKEIGKKNLARALAFLTVLCVVMLWGIDSYAVSGTGTNISTNLNEYYECDLNLLSMSKTTVLQHASNNGFNTSNVTGNWSGPNMSQSIYNNYFNGLSNYSFSIIDNIITTDNQVLDFSTTPYHVFTVPSSAYTESHSYSIIGNGNMCLLITSNQSKYIVSDSQFDVGLCTRYGSDSFSYNFYHSTEQNGFYVCPWQLGSNAELCFTDLPIYLTSSDGSTGFTNFDNNTTDFSFSNSNYNFNYYMTEDLIVNPNIPVIVPSDAQYYTNTYMTCNYERTQDNAFIYANMSFSFNNYQRLHPEQFNLLNDFEIQWGVTNSGVVSDVVSYYYDDDISLLTMIGNQHGMSSPQFTIPLDLSKFKNRNGGTLKSVMEQDIAGALGITVTNDNRAFLEQVFKSIVWDPDNYDTLSAGSTINTFKIIGSHQIETNDIIPASSGVYSSYSDFISGEDGVITNDMPNNLNPPPSDLSPSVIEQGIGSSPNISNSPTFNDGDVILHVDTYNNPFTLDDVSYANLKNMFNDIEDFVDSTSENSFWTVLERTFSYIPAKIWEYLIISVAVICGFAVARYVVRR